MTHEQLPDEWKEWLDLTPLKRFRESEKIFAQYLAMGGSHDPDPDPTSPFYDPQDYAEGGCYAGWRHRLARLEIRSCPRGDAV